MILIQEKKTVTIPNLIGKHLLNCLTKYSVLEKFVNSRWPKKKILEILDDL